MKSAVPAVTALPEARRMAVSEATGIPGDPLFAFHATNRSNGSPCSAYVSSAERM